MSDKMQQRLLSLLAMGVASVLSKPISNFLIEVPEQRGIKDDLKEAGLEGLVRMIAMLTAAVTVRKISQFRRR